MNMAIESAEVDKNLNTLFDDAFKLFNDINNTSEATNSETVQLDIKRAISMLENSTRLVSAANIFSDNEDIEELSSNDIKFLLLPALLGMLHLKICGTDRKELVDNAEIYFKDYLKRCYNYGLTEINEKSNSVENNERPTTEIEIIQRLVNTRTNKIIRYKEQKALDERIAYLKNNLDEDVKREFYTTLIKSYIYQVVDELKSIDMERPMLEMYIQQRNRPSKQRPKPPPPTPLKPVIITKDAVQKAVFGAGYPSLPTMTVKEFYDKRVADGIFPDPNKKVSTQPTSLQEMAMAGIAPDQDDEAAEREQKLEQDDPETLERMRQQDEMKDEFRRGYGNRMNRS